eukprot:scaffold99556_cov15-Tisochrysis_lutea.AAC.1
MKHCGGDVAWKHRKNHQGRSTAGHNLLGRTGQSTGMSNGGKILLGSTGRSTAWHNLLVCTGRSTKEDAQRKKH